MNIDQIAPEALRLPANERALLAATLWESIQDPYQLAVDLEDDEAVSLAVLRDREIESGEVAAVSHEEFMKRVRK
ncbi:MAG: addiction module protein [Akkermansiaceae bacterium]